MSDEIKPDEKKDEKTEPVKVEPVKVQPAKGPHVFKLITNPNTPQIGLGTTVVITPVTGSAVTFIKCQSIKLPVLTGKDVETTGMNDAIDTYIPGVPNAGEAEFDGLYLSTQSASLYAMHNAPGTTFLITYPDGATRTFTGFINSYGEEVPLKEKIQMKIKVRATTKVTNG